MTDNGHDPFVSIDIANDVTVGQLNELALLLQAIDTDRGIRVEPPSQGQLYYKAFAPNEAYRNRDERFLQPWELRLAPSADGVVTGMLTEITEIWTQGVAKPEIETEEHAVASPKALVELMTSRKPDVKVLLIYASRSLSYDALMRYVGPVYATHPIVYVYTEPKENSTAVE